MVGYTTGGSFSTAMAASGTTSGTGTVFLATKFGTNFAFRVTTTASNGYNAVTNNTSQTVDSLCIMGATNTNTTTGLTQYMNGNAFAGNNGTTISAKGVTIGALINNMWSWEGYISEILIYSDVLSTTDRQSVEGYLAWKWGINTSLPSSHPYYSTEFSYGS